MHDLLRVLKAISNENRLRILKILEEKPMCVCEIRKVLELSQPAVSRHLTKLKDAGLIRSRKEGIWVNYLIPDRFENHEVRDILRYIGGLLNEDETVKRDRNIAREVDRTKICGVKNGR